MQGELDILRARATGPARSVGYRPDSRTCFQCKKTGHLKANCFLRPESSSYKGKPLAPPNAIRSIPARPEKMLTSIIRLPFWHPVALPTHRAGTKQGRKIPTVLKIDFSRMICERVTVFFISNIHTGPSSVRHRGGSFSNNARVMYVPSHGSHTLDGT